MLYEPLMSGNYRRNTNFGAAANTAAPPTGMGDYIDKFIVQYSNVGPELYAVSHILASELLYKLLT